MEIMSEYQRWLSSSRVPEIMKQQLLKMEKEDIEDAFFKNIEFGTAGMRGILGPGTNRMNIFTVQKATIAFAMYLLEKYPHAITDGVVIAHDNRHFSREFTEETAEVLNCFGIKAYLFDSLRPTPELSYAVRKLKACGGIVITASHNPKEYNGYKVYDENGCQLVPYKINRLLEILATLPNELELEVPHDQKKGETIILPSSIDDDYVNDVLSIRLNPDLPKANYKIVYTPQHGTSYVNAMKIFEKAGYCIIPVIDQCSPDPDFSHTLSPNPEEKKAYIEALEIAKKEKADLILMTDPDADRVGMAYLSSKGTYEYFNGNESGALVMDYIFSQKQERGLLSKDGIMFNTIVTSSLGTAIAEYYGIKVESLLTGFKFIGDRIYECETKNLGTFEFGYEESYGCLIAPFVRDKDGLQALLMMAEMGVFYANKGLHLDEAIEQVFKRIGKYYKDDQHSKFFKGESGLHDMNLLMDKMRSMPLSDIAGYKVVRIEDYLKSVAFEKGQQYDITLPKSNVIKFILEGGSSIAVRPSGTEPKCKFYINAVSPDKQVTERLIHELYEDFSKKINL